MFLFWISWRFGLGKIFLFAQKLISPEVCHFVTISFVFFFRFFSVRPIWFQRRTRRKRPAGRARISSLQGRPARSQRTSWRPRPSWTHQIMWVGQKEDNICSFFLLKQLLLVCRGWVLSGPPGAEGKARQCRPERTERCFLLPSFADQICLSLLFCPNPLFYILINSFVFAQVTMETVNARIWTLRAVYRDLSGSQAMLEWSENLVVRAILVIQVPEEKTGTL